MGELVTPETIVTNAEDHVLYAQWTANQYTVTFDTQGGSEVTPESIIVNYGAAYGELPESTREGYTFDGWWTQPGELGQRVDAETLVNNARDHALYAHWLANVYTVGFDAHGGSDPVPASLELAFGAAYGELAKTEREGYSFEGWWTEAEGGELIEAESLVAIAEDPNPLGKSVTFGASYGALATTSRSGYTFAGWWTASSGGSQILDSTTVTTASDHTLYARWTANTYTVTLDKQSGTGGTSSVTAVYGAAMPAATAPTRSGYNFAGYYSAVSGGGTQYYTATMSSATNWNRTANTTLYAYWIRPQSCLSLLQSGTTSSGVYNLDPDGNGVYDQVYCDMTTDGGGWTLVSSSNYPVDDLAQGYSTQLTTLSPSNSMSGIWNGMRPRLGNTSDIRFACKTTESWCLR
jgi:uncharacterized repeat protein (TIGR02543 family)